MTAVPKDDDGDADEIALLPFHRNARGMSFLLYACLTEEWESRGIE